MNGKNIVKQYSTQTGIPHADILPRHGLFTIIECVQWLASYKKKKFLEHIAVYTCILLLNIVKSHLAKQ